MNLRRHLKKELYRLTKDHLKKAGIDLNTSGFSLSRASFDYAPNLALGHYASNVSMLLTKVLEKKPHDIAGDLKKKILEDSEIKDKLEKVEIAGAGFLNFFLNSNAFSIFFEERFSIEEWLDSSFKPEEKNAPKKIHFEFVSANPTGPLNIVSARSAAIGDSICRVLKRTQKQAFKEYYVNDFGNQVQLLGISFAARYLQSQGIPAEVPENGYHGEYIKDVLASLLKKNQLPEPLADIQSLRSGGKGVLENWLREAGQFFTPLAIEALLESHKKDLKDFRVEFDHFFSEKILHQENQVEECFQILSERGHVYEKDGAFLFKSMAFGDDKDRVLKKSDTAPTYFLSDIAYHLNKFSRGYSHVYDMWGPDHHGYIARLKGALQASLGEEISQNFEVLIVQQVNLIEQGKSVVMSKRLGQFHSMRDLIDKIPVDVSRYFFVSRSQSQHLNFDLELALDQSDKNPVYYIQYAHARIHSIFRECVERGVIEKRQEAEVFWEGGLQRSFIAKNLDQWTQKAYRNILLFELLRFVDELDMISENREVHKLTTYLYDLAHSFTKFYHHPENRIIRLLEKSNPEDLRAEGTALLRICQITAMVLKEGLSLIGIRAPDQM